MKTSIALITLLLAFGASAQSNEHKHDLGIKISSFQPERLQLQYRFHLNQKWAFTANAYYGSEGFYSQHGNYLIPDSLFELHSTDYRQISYGLSIGAQRQLSFMKHNFYYVGGSIGFGTVTYNRNIHTTVYIPEPGMQSYYSGGPPMMGEIVDSDHQSRIDNAINLKSRVFLGADVPIVDRLTFNFEMGIILDARFNVMDQFNFVTNPGYLSGGLRYNFKGKTKE